MAEVAPTAAPAEEQPSSPTDGKPSGTSGGSSAKARSSMAKAEKQKKTFAEKYIPKLAIYLFKFVCINNSRLALMYYLLMLWCIVCIIGYFMVNDEYMVDTTPWVRHFVYAKWPAEGGGVGYAMDTLADVDLTKSVCKSPELHKYKNNVYDYSNFGEKSGCAMRCGRNLTRQTLFPDEICIYPDEMIQSEGAMVFVPTFIHQMAMIPHHSVYNASGNHSYLDCPAGYVSGTACMKENMVFIPGAGGVKIEITHQYTSKPKQGAWLFASDDERAQSRSKKGHGHDEKGLKTYLIGTDGEVIRTFNSGDVIEVTVDELLAAAEYDGVGPEGALNLDQEVLRKTMGLNSSLLAADDKGVVLRMLGATVTIDLYTTDKGECYHSLTDEKLEFKSDGPIACMFVFAERMWTSSGSTHSIHNSDSPPKAGYLTRTSNGIRIKFRNRGAFTSFDLTELLKIFTVAVVWIQIPLQVVYYFTIFCLGHLSSVYSRVIHQDLHLADACKGLASRLVSHSAAYMDLQDQSTGISKSRLLERFKVVLESNKNLDEVEIVKFVDFVFEGMQSLSQASSTDQSSDTVNIQEYCTACSTNEPLDFDSLVKLFDKDRRIGMLEGCFLDESIRAVVRSARLELAEEREAAMRDQEEAQATMIETLYMLNDLKGKTSEIDGRLNRSISSSSKSLQADVELASKAKIIAESRRSAGKNVIDPVSDFKVTEDPKPDQRESNCSVADEDEVGRQPAGEA